MYFTAAQQFGIAGKIVDNLRHQTAKVNGVCAGDGISVFLYHLVECPVSHQTFYAVLAIVKIALYGRYANIISLLRDHLQPLRRGNPVIGITDHNRRIRLIRKALQGRLARIAAGGYQNQRFFLFANRLGAIRHQQRQQLQRHIFERQRRPVIQLHGIKPRFNLRNRHSFFIGKRGIGLLCQILHFLHGNGIKKAVQNPSGCLFIRQTRQRLDLV